ncbi:hypothetical protein LTR86_007288 [Recurvomyces mirabilis]|nr:hypothetical protein LTR86_007288 [Recurvomyces mirabilis]
MPDLVATCLWEIVEAAFRDHVGNTERRRLPQAGTPAVQGRLSSRAEVWKMSITSRKATGKAFKAIDMCVQSHVTDELVVQNVLLMLPTRRLGKISRDILIPNPKDVLWYFVPAQSLSDPASDLYGIWTSGVLSLSKECYNLLAELGVWSTDDGCFHNAAVTLQTFFDLGRYNVFATRGRKSAGS